MAIDVSNDIEGTRRFYDENGYTVPAAFDPGQEVAARRYGVIATPTNYLIDAEGRVIWRHYGFMPGDEIELRHEIVEALGERD